MSDLKKEADRLRKQAAELEGKFSKSLALITDSKWTSSRLWITIGAIAGLILLKKMGFDLGELTGQIIFLVIVLLVLRTVTDVSRDWARVALEWISARYAKEKNPAADPDANNQ
jgi:divalent metal cation (Fe/Co/Zn/Cd) transporter